VSGATALEIGVLNTQYDLLESQLRMSAVNAWTAYLEAKAHYDMAVEARPQLEADLELIENLFRLGFISDIEHRAQRYSIYEALNMESVALIVLEIAVAEIDFMMIGVVGR
jgi:outer membrane protein TolC